MLLPMKISKLSLDAIDLADETFRISEVLESDTLRSSLREVGQLNPVHLRENGSSGLIVVCGHRRLDALRHNGSKTASCAIHSVSDLPVLRAFEMAIWDNVSHRQFCPLEKARILNALCRVCALSQETVILKYLPILGLACHKNVLECFLRLNSLQADFRLLLMREWITLATAQRLSQEPQEEQRHWFSVFSRARFSASLQKQVMDLTEDAAFCRGMGCGAILKQTELQSVLADDGRTMHEKGEIFHRTLYEMAHPRLTNAREQFRAGRDRLGLPGSIRLIRDPFFETARVKVEFEAASPGGFRAMTDALLRASRLPELDAIFAIE